MAETRASWIGVPEQFELNAACQIINKAFGQCYHVGSSLERRDWRDVDVRCIMDDGAFERAFGKSTGRNDLNARWAITCIAISHWLQKRTGLPVDFQIQARTPANNEFPDGQRSALGLYLTRDLETPLTVCKSEGQ